MDVQEAPPVEDVPKKKLSKGEWNELQSSRLVTPEFTKNFCALIRAGNYPTPAAAALGVSAAAISRVLRAGARQKSGPLRDFYTAVKMAENACESDYVQFLAKAAQHSWQANLAFLERRFPKRWGKTNEVNITHRGEINVNVIQEGIKLQQFLLEQQTESGQKKLVALMEERRLELSAPAHMAEIIDVSPEKAAE